MGRPQVLLHRRNVSNVRVGLANGTKRTPSQNWGNLLSELHVPHKQCLTGISNAFSASLTSIWPSPNKACLLCATPAGTYRVQSPGFPKLSSSAVQSVQLFTRNPIRTVRGYFKRDSDVPNNRDPDRYIHAYLQAQSSCVLVRYITDNLINKSVSDDLPLQGKVFQKDSAA